MLFKCWNPVDTVSCWLDKRMQKKIDRGIYRWFAWYPVKVHIKGKNFCVWLEQVNRSEYRHNSYTRELKSVFEKIIKK